MRKLEDDPPPEKPNPASIRIWKIWRRLMIYRCISIETKLTFEQVVSKLFDVTEKESYSFWSSWDMPSYPKKLYTGKISPEGFKLYAKSDLLIRRGRNSFLLTLNGNFIETDGGLCVNVEIAFDESLAVFFVGSSFLLLTFSLFTFTEIITHGFQLSMLLNLGIPLFFVFASYIAAQITAANDQKSITDLFS